MARSGASSLLTMVLTLFAACPARAHSWYPHECCSQQDCVAADAVSTDGQGSKSVIVGQVQIPIPDGTRPGLSPDGRVHVCFRTWAGDRDGLPTFMLVCLFLPPEA
jgi:hypothetical protein